MQDFPKLDIDPKWNDFRKIRSLRHFLKAVGGLNKHDVLKQDYLQAAYRAEDLERYLTYKYDYTLFCLEVMEAEAQGDVPQKWARVHFRLCRFIRRCRNLGKRAFIQLPRHHLKTHICTIYYRIWRLLYDPDICSLVVSGTLGLSKDAITAVKGFLMASDKVQRYWPHVVKERLWRDRMNKWSETAFNVERKKQLPQCTVEAVGVGATVAGKHFAEITFDDLVTIENSTTPDQCEKVINYYRYYLSVVNPAKVRGKIPIMVVGTPYTDHDLYTFLREPEILRQFAFFIQPIYDEVGQLIWNPPFTKEVVAEILKAQGTYIFSCQYLLDPVPKEMMEFRGEWILRYHALPRDLSGNEVHVQREMVVDPITYKKTDSTSKARGVILVVGRDTGGIWWVEDYKLFDRAKEGQMFSGIFEMSQKHNVPHVWWEEVAYQSQGKVNLEDEKKRRGLPLQVRGIKPGHRDKDTRIRALIPFFERGQIRVKYWMTELILELTRFPKGQTKDIMDALAYFTKIFVTAPSKLTTTQKSWLGQHAMKPFYR